MQEITFLHQNASKWKRFETLMADQQADPDTLVELFIELTDDLSYARTFYPDSKTTQYLNGLTMHVHQKIYKNKKEEKSRVVTYWKEELPGLFYMYRNPLLYAAIIFVVSVSIGALSAANDVGFVRLILGDGYVNMTLENINRGDPLAVYKTMSQGSMFFMITLNNIKVSFYAFTAGLIFSFGTGLVLLYNGIMLGAFHYMFFEEGLLGQSIRTIWIHGALEISAIVIAGGAGLVIGNSFLFPGTYTRLESFQRGARDGMKIVIGLIPIFIVAGILESFVTRYTAMPLWLSLLFITGSFTFIFWYVGLYPRHLVKQEASYDE